MLGTPRETFPAGGCFTPFEEWHYGGRLSFDTSAGLRRLFMDCCPDAIVHFETNGCVVLVLIPDWSDAQ